MKNTEEKVCITFLSCKNFHGSEPRKKILPSSGGVVGGADRAKEEELS